LVGRSEAVLDIEHGFRDPRIGPAAAEISAHGFAYPLRVVARLPFIDQADRAHDLARGTEPALKAVMRDESGLYGMELAAIRNALDRENVSAVAAGGERKARIDPSPI
jgi:hypothetical protein